MGADAKAIGIGNNAAEGGRRLVARVSEANPGQTPPPLQGVFTQTGVFCDPCEHARTDFVAVVKREDEIRPPWALQDAMRALCRLTVQPIRNHGDSALNSITSRSLRRNRRQLEHTAVFRRFGDIASAQGERHGFKLARIVG